MTVPYIITDNSITFITDKVVSIDRSHANFDAVREAIYDDRITDAIELTDLPPALKNYEGTDIEIRHNTVYCRGTPLHNSLTRRIIQMIEQDRPVDPLIKFLDNLMQNPSNRAIEELYDFLEYGRMPITADGHFLAYKRVRDDFKDCHSGTIDNSPGQFVTMPRGMVDDRSDNTCSHGLHFCSHEYLRHFHGSRLIVLKINPRDVVSIPKDYNNTKGRCCGYEVLRELDMPEAWVRNIWEDEPVIEDDSADYDNDIEYGDPML